MSFITPNMGLTLPTVGVDAGPLYATLLDNALQSVDSHSHVAGQGVQITPSAININSALVMNNQALTLASEINMQSTVVNVSGTLSVVGNDLQYVNGAGVTIPLTIGSSIAGAPGNISGITGTAGVTYYPVTKLFKFESSTSTAAYIDCASILLRNISPNSTYSYTLNPPSNLTSNYNVVLPTIPSSTKVLTIDASGNMGSALITDSLVSNFSLTGLSIADNTLDTSKFQNGSITPVKTSFPGSSFSGAILIDNTTNGSKITDATLSAAKTAFGSQSFNADILVNNTVISSKIADKNVTINKLDNIIGLSVPSISAGTIVTAGFIGTINLGTLSRPFNERPVYINLYPNTNSLPGSTNNVVSSQPEYFAVRNNTSGVIIATKIKAEDGSFMIIDNTSTTNVANYSLYLTCNSGSVSYGSMKFGVYQP